MAENPPLRLPDILKISESFKTGAEELALLSNLPQIQEGNAILQQLQIIQTSLAELKTQGNANTARLDIIAGRVDAIVGRVEDVQHHLSANDHNTSARLFNAQIDSSRQRLQSLRSVRTNQELVDFPHTSDHIREMRRPQLIALLGSMGENATGNAEVLRLRLRRAIGLKERVA